MRFYPVLRRLSPALLSLTLAACRNTQPSELNFPEARVAGLSYTFKGQDQVELPAETAFKVRDACPVITKARYEPNKKGEMGTLQVYGRGLNRVARLAASQNGLIGESPPHLDPDGGLRFAVGCRTCELVLGMQVEDRMVGCRGPGHSLRLDRGRLIDGWEEPAAE